MRAVLSLFQACQFLGDALVDHVLQVFRVNGHLGAMADPLGLAGTVEISPYLSVLARLSLNGGHGVAALLTYHLSRQPAGRIAVAIGDLPVLLQFPLAFEPDFGIHDSGVAQQNQPHIRPIRVACLVFGVSIELGTKLSRKLGDIRNDFRPVAVVVVVHVGIRLDVNGVFQQGGKLCRSPVTAIQWLFALSVHDIHQPAQGNGFLGIYLKEIPNLLRLRRDRIQLLRFNVVDDRGHQLEAVGSASPHVEAHLAAMEVGLGDTVDDGCPLKLGENHQDFDDQVPIRGGGVKRFLGGHKLHLIFLKLLQDVHEVGKGAAHPVQLIHNHLADLTLADQPHHFLKPIPVHIPSGIAVIDEGDHLFPPFFWADHHPAILNLGFTADTVFPFHGFAGIES